MALPEGTTMTKVGRKAFAYLDEQTKGGQPEPQLNEIAKACGCGIDTACKWRKLWRQHGDDPHEAPPPKVRHRVDAMDPLSVFSPTTKASHKPTPPAEPAPQDTPSDERPSAPLEESPQDQDAGDRDGPDGPPPDNDDDDDPEPTGPRRWELEI